MSEIGNRLRDLFTEIAPPVDVNGIVRTGATPVETRRGWLVAVAAAAVVLLLGVGSFLLFGGSDLPTETAGGVAASTSTSGGTSTTSIATESTTTVPEDGFVPQVLRPVRIDCNSELASFPCSALVDADETTRWNAVEGGVGAQITLLFAQPVQITSIDLVNVGDPEPFARNARIRGLEIVFDDMPGVTAVELDDTYAQSVQVESVGTTVVALRVTSAYPGQAYEGKEPFSELALAEIQVWGREAPSVEGGPEITVPAEAPAFSGNGWQLILREEANGESGSWKVCHRFAPAEGPNEANGFGPSGCVTWPDDTTDTIIMDVIPFATPGAAESELLFVDLTAEAIDRVTVTLNDGSKVETVPFAMPQSGKQFAVVELPAGTEPVWIELWAGGEVVESRTTSVSLTG